MVTANSISDSAGIAPEARCAAETTGPMEVSFFVLGFSVITEPRESGHHKSLNNLSINLQFKNHCLTRSSLRQKDWLAFTLPNSERMVLFAAGRARKSDEQVSNPPDSHIAGSGRAPVP
jgi:hypothetical protein